MRRILVLALAMTTGALSLSSNPVGNLTDATMFRRAGSQDDPWSFRAGYMGDFILNRRMRPQKRGDFAGLHGKLKRTLHGLDATLNINDAIDLSGRMGYTSHKLDVQIAGDKFHFKTKPMLAFGFGFRAKIYKIDNTAISVHGFYSQDRSKINQTSQYTDDVFVAKQSNLKRSYFTLRDKTYSAGLMVSHRFDECAPYIGVQFVRNGVKMQFLGSANPNQILKLKNRNAVGGVIGAALVNSGPMSLNFECRIINELALGVLGQYRF